MPPSGTFELMLASTVIYAKRNARLYTKTSGDAQIQADIIKRLGRVLNVAGDAKVALIEENIIELTSEKRVAVAYAPAYTIRDTGQADAAFVVAPYDRENPDSREALLNWLLNANLK
jgi:hypothetical protein